MAKLNIDFAVNLGNSISGLNSFKDGLDSLSTKLKEFSNSLKSISNLKIDIDTGKAIDSLNKLKQESDKAKDPVTKKVTIEASAVKDPYEVWKSSINQTSTGVSALQSKVEELQRKIETAKRIIGDTSSEERMQRAIQILGSSQRELNKLEKFVPKTKEQQVSVNAGPAVQANQVLSQSTQQSILAITDLKTRIAELNAQIVSSQNVIANTTSQEERTQAIKNLSAAQSELNKILAATPKQTLATLNLNPQQVTAYANALGASGVQSNELSNRISVLQGRITQLDSIIANTSSEQQRITALKLLKQTYTELGQLQKVQLRISPETTPTPVKPAINTAFANGPLGNIFDKYIQGTSTATTVTGFLREEEKRLTAEIKKLQQIVDNTSSLTEYSSALKQIQVNSEQLRAVQNADPFNKLKASANQANVVLTNVGRVAQDLPFGFLGIANNLNPLVESFGQLSKAAKEAGTTVGKQLLSSLTGFGGLGLIISAVSAALSFASIGLSYWNREAKKGKEATDEFKKAVDGIKDSAAQEASTVAGLIGILNNENETRERKVAALKELKSINPEIFGALNQEKLSVNALNTAYQTYLQSLQTVIAVQTKKIQLEKVLKELIDLGAGPLTEREKALAKSFDNINNKGKQSLRSLGAEGANAASQLDKIEESQNRIKNDKIKALQQQAAFLQGDITELSKGIEVKIDTTGSETEKTNAQKILDLYKEINDDLAAIASRRDLNPLEKTEKSIGIIQSGFTKILDINANEINNVKFVALEKQLEGLKVREIRLKADLEVSDLKDRLSRLREEAIIFNKPTIDKQIQEAQQSIDRLFQLYQDKKILKNAVAKEDILADIADVQAELNKLSLQKIFIDSKNVTKSLKNDLSKLKDESILFDRPTLDKQISTAEKAVDALYEKFQDPLLTNLIDIAKVGNELIQAQEILDGLNAQKGAKNIQDDLAKSLAKLDKSLIISARLALVGDWVGSLKKKLDGLQSYYNEYLASDAFNLDIAKKLKLEIDETKVKLAAAEAASAFAEQFGGDVGFAIGEYIGNALTNVSNQDWLANLTKQFGESLKAFGKQIILGSKLILAAKEALSKAGPAGIIAGIALVALGTAITNRANETLNKASGGYISGPGSGTSDSIPARLSNGEYVVKARSVSKYGIGFLNAVNNGTLKKFAVGGAVSNIPIPNFAAPNVTITEPMGQQVPYIATTQIKGQDLKLVLQRADSSYNRIV